MATQTRATQTRAVRLSDGRPGTGRRRSRASSLIAVLAIAVVVAACGGAASTASPSASAAATPTQAAATPQATQTQALTAAPTPTPRPTAAATPTPPPVEHRIGVRVVDGAGELFDRTTGAKFVPRGANLVRLDSYHDTLDPSAYDPTRIEATFARMQADGYNVVRVFNDHRVGGLVDATGRLSGAYLDDAVDLLARAKAHGIYVMFTQDWLPEGPVYAFASDPGIEDVNAFYLSGGGLTASAAFEVDFAAGLIARHAALDAVFAFELRNELYFSASHAPFSMKSGTVTTANGKTYDMADAASRRKMLDEGLNYWIDRVRSDVLAVDPTALVTVGFFQPQQPNPSRLGDDRLIETAAAISSSSADFIDLHAYPGSDINLPQYVQNYGLPKVTVKPILMGEFGTAHDQFATVSAASTALVNWQVQSCGYGFDGWLLWTWDTTEQPDFWNAVDQGGVIEKALAPSKRPDPCKK
jgi:hypothetical protein